MTKTLAAAVLTVLALTLSACGGNDDATASKNISASLMKAQKSGGASQLFTLKKKDADCIGNGFVDKIGTDKLQKYKFLTKDNASAGKIDNLKMSATDATAASTVLFGCTDISTKIKGAITGSGNVPAAMKACIDKALTDKVVRGVITKTFEGRSSEIQKDLTAPLTRCATGSGG